MLTGFQFYKIVMLYHVPRKRAGGFQEMRVLIELYLKVIKRGHIFAYLMLLTLL